MALPGPGAVDATRSPATELEETFPDRRPVDPMTPRCPGRTRCWNPLGAADPSPCSSIGTPWENISVANRFRRRRS